MSVLICISIYIVAISDCNISTELFLSNPGCLSLSFQKIHWPMFWFEISLVDSSVEFCLIYLSDQFTFSSVSVIVYGNSIWFGVRTFVRISYFSLVSVLIDLVRNLISFPFLLKWYSLFVSKNKVLFLILYSPLCSRLSVHSVQRFRVSDYF